MDLLSLQASDADFQNTNITRASKEALARLLAQENILVRYDTRVSTASFDLQNRVCVLPVWKNISRYLHDLLVVHEIGHALDTPTDGWKNEIEGIASRIYGAKANNHIRQVVQYYLNIVEDVRIDRKQRNRYPGCRKDYAYGYKELIVIRDLFKLKNSNEPISERSFMDRANVYFKGGRENLNIPFTPEEQSYLLKMDNTNTWEDVARLAEELFLRDKKQIEELLQQASSSSGNSEEKEENSDKDNSSNSKSEKKKSENKEGNSSGKKENDQNSDDSESGENSSESDSKNSDDQDGEGSSDGEDGETDYNNVDAPNLPSKENSDEKNDSDKQTKEKPDVSYETPVEKPAGTPGGGDGVVVPVLPSTVKTLEDELKKFVENPFGSNTSNEFVYATVPTPKIDRIVDDYKTVMKQWKGLIVWSQIKPRYATWRRKESSTIGFLINEFEMKKAAELHKRESINKTGRLNMGKLHQYKFNDDLFLRNSVLPKGKNHGFIMIVDWSSSMASNIDNTLNQMFSIATFCKRMNIPFDAYIFRDINGRDRSWNYKTQSYDNSVYSTENNFSRNSGELDLPDVKLRNILSSRMSVKEFQEAADALMGFTKRYESIGDIDGMTSTPLNSAIAAAPELVKQFKERTRVEIVNVVILTDGDSNPCYGPIGGPTGKYFWAERPTEKNRNILQDKKLKIDYPMDSFFGRELTFALLQNLKDKTGCNLVGFYLYGGNVESVINYTLPVYIPALSDELKKRYLKFAQKNGFVPINSAGYDEYYFVFTGRYSNVSAYDEEKVENEMNINPDQTVKTLANELTKSINKKNFSRALLRRFIDLVSGTQGVKRKLDI